jgi:hypothetical protein
MKNKKTQTRPTPPSSPFAKFHKAFKGYHFLDNITGKTFKKYQLWHSVSLHNLALTMLSTKTPVNRFKLVDAPNWKNGKLI